MFPSIMNQALTVRCPLEYLDAAAFYLARTLLSHDAARLRRAKKKEEKSH